jgi:hypothetical protein
VEVLYERGFGAIAVFTTAALFGNVVMLNLLIAIVRPSQDAAPLPVLPSHRGSWQVSDEFDQYMERASLEALMALAMLCKEAREVRSCTTLPAHPVNPTNVLWRRKLAQAADSGVESNWLLLLRE